MWRLFHRLFGWHYIAHEFGSTTSINRIKTDINRDPYIWCYGRIRRLSELNKPLPLTKGAINALEYAQQVENKIRLERKHRNE